MTNLARMRQVALRYFTLVRLLVDLSRDSLFKLIYKSQGSIAAALEEQGKVVVFVAVNNVLVCCIALSALLRNDAQVTSILESKIVEIQT